MKSPTPRGVGVGVEGNPTFRHLSTPYLTPSLNKILDEKSGNQKAAAKKQELESVYILRASDVKK